ncbi:cytochrome c1 [Psychrobium sp. 1_MG-2023]|uniref:cytochrome c1 n=1 Tax=Psychrobium sp. 1_MG-2023 TaxID=3062624 RepID=UPI000C328C3B|nr:cytochrome c1 [Psychrobium sp. 1_MG-2023]MDP2560683.1 cytochrome c1 [Psychrobium sp. 1_MG-2023]PKF56579.1 cytochrome c1 [Alteromonadales bacterium alter-6D02]
MKKFIIALVTLLPTLALAAGGGAPTLSAPIDPTDKASLQNGAKLFMNYCLGCHETKYQRYNRIAKDLDIPENLMKENLIFTGVKIGNLIENAPTDAALGKWFGITPPDLTLVARSRGTDWVYTYLKSFYVDPERPFGVNNTMLPGASMPHVLQGLQGVPTATFELDENGVKQIVKDENGIVITTTDGSGELSVEEYDKAVTDITNFLHYAGEPSKLERESLGRWVIGFLCIFFILAYLLKKEYWRDIH